MNADVLHRSAYVFFLACAVALTGCPREATTASPDSEASVDDQPIPTDTNFINGRAFYLERIKIAPGADFTVDLVEQQHPDVTLATTTLEDVAGPPYDFALQYDPAKLRADGRYALAAVLRGADGAVLFTTPAPVPVKTGDANIVEFRMVRAGAGDVPQPAGQLQRTHWTCDGMTLDAAFDTEGRRVELALPDGMLSLPLAISASGARYLDHRGNEFWTTGDRGTFTREGGKKVDCVRRDASAAGSPWEDAKMRGIAFRAIGTEPGWMLEVSRGARPTLHAELDYGERVLDVAALQPLSGPLGYVGAAADGARVRLVLERRACSDGMSDERYPVAVQLQAGDRSYLGCGRFLGD